MINEPAQSCSTSMRTSEHQKLAGSEEVLKITQVTPGPVGFGTMYQAEERVWIGDEGMELGAKGVVVTFDAPNTYSYGPESSALRP